MRRHIVVTLATLAAAAVLSTAAGAASAVPASPRSAGPQPAVITHAGAAGDGEDHAHDTFQPGYLGGRTVVYRPGAPVAGAPVKRLFQVRYPDGWAELTARPQCAPCDHFGNGPDAGDYHDHVLSRPNRAANAAGKVTWHVYDVRPAYTGKADHDTAVSAAYSRLLPVQSTAEVRRLLRARLSDGSPLAVLVDTGVQFGGPITSRY